MKIYLTIVPDPGENFLTFEARCNSIESLEMELGRFERHVYKKKLIANDSPVGTNIAYEMFKKKDLHSEEEGI